MTRKGQGVKLIFSLKDLRLVVREVSRESLHLKRLINSLISKEDDDVGRKLCGFPY